MVVLFRVPRSSHTRPSQVLLLPGQTNDHLLAASWSRARKSDFIRPLLCNNGPAMRSDKRSSIDGGQASPGISGAHSALCKSSSPAARLSVAMATHDVTKTQGWDLQRILLSYHPPLCNSRASALPSHPSVVGACPSPSGVASTKVTGLIPYLAIALTPLPTTPTTETRPSLHTCHTPVVHTALQSIPAPLPLLRRYLNPPTASRVPACLPRP